MLRTTVWPDDKTRGQRGFSLMEVLVALAINSLLLAVVMSFFSFQVTTAKAQDGRRSAQMTARETMGFLVRHISGIGRANATRFTDLAPAIIEAQADSMHYQTNLSEDWGDNDLADPWEDVEFSYDATSQTILFEDNNNLTFFPGWLTDVGTGRKSYVPAGGLSLTYFDAAGNAVAPGAVAADRASIRRITISLTVRGIIPGQALGSADEPEVTMSQEVFLRNVS